ncbi:zinc-dependent alcohol dehydrogenase family protein [Pseudomonas corrugata]|uniref:Zinc-dependent alcohol dehydrogenase family protein n=1 Tax=Pseudomonas corrugata TaxID=47879 RepID=A0A7Y5Z1R3_9PSED|nr:MULTISPECIES: zinc-dependent alcohol dehydrogenase family protein [Pseudomonas]MCI0995345.1 zinc-dependent alcohol dehydrogenase family protein [Pseudomonas corrugata]NUT66051.1 zinc-dependent alcohol dehydrogenase family protein [Pseudomonas corrugata]NUT85179.1 zinc-dependent alcohol dehydrogenase family protein [Pseudomonas corrugata]TNF84620.1 zinc-dependent alcohol dehydrogenase family protein [Pseudomonas sp. ICMP22404]
MRAMVLHSSGQPLKLEERALPIPARGQLLIKVLACGVCRTDLHLFDGELPQARLPRVPGHEIVGQVTAVGTDTATDWIGRRVGVPWLGWTCGICEFCRSGRENLCDQALFTGCQLDGGYADYTVADARFCFPLPDALDAAEAAPLLCAGLIGFRALQMAQDAPHLGLYGFGAAAHLAIQVAVGRGQQVYAFTRPDDDAGQAYARSLGATWAGPSDRLPPHLLDASLIFAPVGELVPLALKATAKGGCVVCAGIHMSDIPSFPYRLLWEERSVRSVANLTRADGVAFFQQLQHTPVHCSVTCLPLIEANQALEVLRSGQVNGAIVLIP